MAFEFSYSRHSQSSSIAINMYGVNVSGLHELIQLIFCILREGRVILHIPLPPFPDAHDIPNRLPIPGSDEVAFQQSEIIPNTK